MNDIGVKVKLVKIWEKLPLSKIRPFEGQPREYFSEIALQELAESLGFAGQMDLIKVIAITGDPDGYTHQIVDGERRWRSAKKAKMETIGALEIEVVAEGRAKNVSVEGQLFFVASVSNVAKVEHLALEFAQTLGRVQKDFGLTVKELAKAYGKGDQTITNHLNVLKLPPGVHALMGAKVTDDKRLSAATALLLLGWPEAFQVEIATEAVAKGWTKSETARVIALRTRGKQIPREGMRQRTATNDYQTLEAVLARIEERTGLLVDIPTANIEEVLRRRGRQAKVALMDDLNRSIKVLIRIRDIVTDVDLRAAS